MIVSPDHRPTRKRPADCSAMPYSNFPMMIDRYQSCVAINTKRRGISSRHAVFPEMFTWREMPNTYVATSVVTFIRPVSELPRKPPRAAKRRLQDVPVLGQNGGRYREGSRNFELCAFPRISLRAISVYRGRCFWCGINSV